MTNKQAETKYHLPTDKAVSPSSQEVLNFMKAFAKKHKSLSSLSKLGSSTEGRPIYGMRLTDSSVSAQHKQHVIVVGGRHGNEESGRLIALQLMEYLVGAGKKYLKNQKIVIIPNANPDACERDIYVTPSGKQVAYDYQSKKPIAETAAFLKAITPLRPELMIDLHARGQAGCSTDMVLYPEAKYYCEDDNIFHHLAHDMCAAGERAGIPHLTHPLKWWHDGFCGVVSIAYELFKSIPMLTETAESNTDCHSVQLRGKVGVARIVEALKWGELRHAGLYASGYPCQIIAGSYAKGITAIGKTAAARRKSRIEAWMNRDHMSWKGVAPEADRLKRVALIYKGKPLNHGLGIQLQSRHRRKPKMVKLNGRKLRISETNGFVTWFAKGGNLVMVNIPKLQRGSYEVEIEY